jgi:Pvc16 N-terminal domain
MIDVALQFLKGEINTFLLAGAGSDNVKVKLSSLVDHSGKFAFDQESIGASLINFEEERIVKTHLPQHEYVNGQFVMSEPELKLNLYLLFAANFKIYEEALKYLSHILTYFQGQSSFTQAEFPGLDPRIEKLMLELQSPSFEQWNHIWGFNGGKQLPAVLYKVRLVVLRPGTPAGIHPPISRLSATLQSK